MIKKAGPPVKKATKKEVDGETAAPASDKYSGGVFGDFDSEIEKENKHLNAKENNYSGQEGKARDSQLDGEALTKEIGGKALATEIQVSINGAGFPSQ